MKTKSNNCLISDIKTVKTVKTQSDLFYHLCYNLCEMIKSKTLNINKFTLNINLINIFTLIIIIVTYN